MPGSRRRPGRLGPFVDGYRARLLELGYAPLSVTRSLTALGRLGRWMDRQDVVVEQFNNDALKAFLADHADEYGHLPSAGVMPLLDYLRDEGVLAPEPARRPSPLDRFIDRYREWLVVERELSPETARGYTRLARRFLAERVSVADELGVERLTGASVTGFLLRESERLRPGSVCCHANQLRQLLRYLSMRGVTDAGLAEAVPSVGRWRDARLPNFPAPGDRCQSSSYSSRVIARAEWACATSRSFYSWRGWACARSRLLGSSSTICTGGPERSKSRFAHDTAPTPRSPPGLATPGLAKSPRNPPPRRRRHHERRRPPLRPGTTHNRPPPLDLCTIRVSVVGCSDQRRSRSSPSSTGAQTSEPTEGPQHTSLTAAGGVGDRELAYDHARGGIVGVDPPSVRMLTALEARNVADHGRRAGKAPEFLERPRRRQNLRSSHPLRPYGRADRQAAASQESVARCDVGRVPLHASGRLRSASLLAQLDLR